MSETAGVNWIRYGDYWFLQLFKGKISEEEYLDKMKLTENQLVDSTKEK